eukprot:6187352-Pleurochrysis_carterae.AAC.2
MHTLFSVSASFSSPGTRVTRHVGAPPNPSPFFASLLPSRHSTLLHVAPYLPVLCPYGVAAAPLAWRAGLGTAALGEAAIQSGRNQDLSIMP